MKTLIPIIIVLSNDSEVTLYKNKKLLPIFVNLMKRNGLYNNCLFLCCDDQNEQYCKDNNIENVYRVHGIGVINHSNDFKSIYKYFIESNDQSDWHITLKLGHSIKNINLIKRAIQNIDYYLDFICFSTKYVSSDDLILYDNKIRNNIADVLIQDKPVNILDTSIFICNTKYFLSCCEKANGNESIFSEELYKGRYKILGDGNQIPIQGYNKEQVDIFVNFLISIQEIDPIKGED